MFYMKREQKHSIVLKKMLFLEKLPAKVKNLSFFILAASTFTHAHLKSTICAIFYNDIQEVLLIE